MSERSDDLESRTRFEPAEVEPRIAARWLQSGLFHPEPEGEAGENYSIAIPPPNVTGSLHMGHALNGSIQDVLIRYHRMAGRRTKWILGTDHAGIATQAQVEKALRAEGLSRQQLGREAFVRARVGVARALRRTRSSSSSSASAPPATTPKSASRSTRATHRAVVEVFVALYEQGLHLPRPLHRQLGPGLALGDLRPRGRGARARRDTLYSIALRPGGRRARSTIATVRPETMLGDTAVAVHPEDERYRELVGRTAILPLVGRHLPVIADEYVKTDFGTGAAEGHPRARPQRLRDRPPPRARPGVGDRRGRAHDRRGRRALRRADGDGGARGGGGGAARGRPDRAGRSPTSTKSPTPTAPASGSSR